LKETYISNATSSVFVDSLGGSYSDISLSDDDNESHNYDSFDEDVTSSGKKVKKDSKKKNRMGQRARRE
jgi:hypothetical protein